MDIIEQHFARQEAFNHANAEKAGLDDATYISLNQGRLDRLHLIDQLLDNLKLDSTMLRKERIHDLACVLEEAYSFAVNNRLFESAIQVEKSMEVLIKIYQPQK